VCPRVLRRKKEKWVEKCGIVNILIEIYKSRMNPTEFFGGFLNIKEKINKKK
jgi:hypothetical protein